MRTGNFDFAPPSPPQPASASPTPPPSKPSPSRRWSTKGDIWSFGLSMWAIAEGSRPFSHLLEDEVLIAAAGA